MTNWHLKIKKENYYIELVPAGFIVWINVFDDTFITFLFNASEGRIVLSFT